MVNCRYVSTSGRAKGPEEENIREVILRSTQEKSPEIEKKRRKEGKIRRQTSTSTTTTTTETATLRLHQLNRLAQFLPNISSPPRQLRNRQSPPKTTQHQHQVCTAKNMVQFPPLSTATNLGHPDGLLITMPLSFRNGGREVDRKPVGRAYQPGQRQTGGLARKEGLPRASSLAPPLVRGRWLRGRCLPGLARKEDPPRASNLAPPLARGRWLRQLARKGGRLRASNPELLQALRWCPPKLARKEELPRASSLELLRAFRALRWCPRRLAKKGERRLGGQRRMR